MTSEIDRIAEERRQKVLARIAKHNGTRSLTRFPGHLE